MSETITFYKFQAAGNDFVLVDTRNQVVKDPKRFAAEVCKQHTGIGADGVLFIEKSQKPEEFFMRIVNSDGSEAEACGNGYRVVGLYASEQTRIDPTKFISIGTSVGPVQIKIASPEAIKVKMVDPTDYHEVSINLGSKIVRGYFINTGVPHVVIFVENLEQYPVKDEGRSIRFHDSFKSTNGTNVNFVKVTGKNSISVRTYERGVEDETLACGTGSTASAIIANLKHNVSLPVEVKTQNGEILKVDFKHAGNTFYDTYLEGSATKVFEGSMKWS